jgi:hypothetical protein
MTALASASLPTTEVGEGHVADLFTAEAFPPLDRDECCLRDLIEDIFESPFLGHLAIILERLLDQA